MTPQERAAAVKHVVYMFGVPEFEVECGEYENALAATVTLQREARRAALLEAAQQVCMHCGKRAIGLQVGVNGPNAAGNYVHNPPEDSRVKESVLCSATSIWSLIRYEDRLAQEGA